MKHIILFLSLSLLAVLPCLADPVDYVMKEKTWNILILLSVIVGMGGAVVGSFKLCYPPMALIGSMKDLHVSVWALFLVFVFRGNNSKAILSVFRPVARNGIRQRLPK